MVFKSTALSVALLSAVFFWAVGSMHGLLRRNGYVAALENLRDSGPHVLPGTDTPLLQRYTGITSIDYQLTVLQCVFANITDGSAIELSLFSFYFAGQLVAAIAVFVVESYRENQVSLFRLTLPWLAVMQLIGFGVILPVYAVLHLILAPTDLSLLSEDALRHPDLLIASIFGGYILPTLLVMIPIRWTHPILHQQLMALWQFFPLILSIFQFVLSFTPAAPKPRNSTNLSTHILQSTYRFGQKISSTTHLATMLVIAISTFCPGLYASIPFIPAKVASQLPTLTFSKVFFPPNPYPNGFNGPTPPMTSMASAIHGFLQWDLYCGIASALIWSISLLVRAKRLGDPSPWYIDTLAVAVSAVLGGPASAVASIMQHRDWVVIENATSTPKKVV